MWCWFKEMVWNFYFSFFLESDNEKFFETVREIQNINTRKHLFCFKIFLKTKQTKNKQPPFRLIIH
jgi:hypothetical protein